MSNDFKIEIPNLARLQGKLGPQAISKPLGDFLKKAALIVQGEAMQKAPVDTGDLRSRIVWEVEGSSPPKWAKIGFKAAEGSPFWRKAVSMEYGSRPHWPPIGAMEPWAGRHGMSAFQAARAIARHGTVARRYLRGGLEASSGKIKSMLGELKAALGKLWSA